MRLETPAAARARETDDPLPIGKEFGAGHTPEGLPRVDRQVLASQGLPSGLEMVVVWRSY